MQPEKKSPAFISVSVCYHQNIEYIQCNIIKKTSIMSYWPPNKNIRSRIGCTEIKLE